MDSLMQRLRALSLAVIFVGGAGFASLPDAVLASPVLGGGCEFCATGCPSDLGQFCQEAECTSGGGSSCTIELCQGESGSWYAYAIYC
jgi:hypothetical protein